MYNAVVCNDVFILDVSWVSLLLINVQKVCSRSRRQSCFDEKAEHSLEHFNLQMSHVLEQRKVKM